MASQQATVSFVPPLDDGGSPILNYTVTSNPESITVTSALPPIVVTGLTNGTAYTFTVHATNANGAGPESIASSAFIPDYVMVPLHFGTQLTLLYQDVITNIPLAFGGKNITLYQDVVTNMPLSYGTQTITLYQDSITNVPLAFN
jgi:hypothetical protein